MPTGDDTVRDQGVFQEGKPEEIMTTSLVKHVFDLDCQTTNDPIYGTPLVKEELSLKIHITAQSDINENTP